MVQVVTNKIERFLRDRLLVYLQKNSDYGDSFNKSLDKYGMVAFQVRAEDKLNRFEKLLGSESKVKDESLKDTILDLFNYAVMARSWKEEDTSTLNIMLNMYYFVESDFERFIDFLVFEEVITNAEEDSENLIDLLTEELRKCV